MYVSPQKASFKKSMRGYKARQVDAYIETLCSEFAGAEEDYQTRILALEKEVTELRAQLEEYEALKQAHEALLLEKERLRTRRFRLIRHAEPDGGEKQEKKEEKIAPTPEQREDKMRRFFRVSADVVRLIGHTGKRVTRVLSALPEPSRSAAPKAEPSLTSKQRKKLEKQQAKELRKKQKQAKKTEKKDKKKNG